MIAAELSTRRQQLNTFRSNINNFELGKIYGHSFSNTTENKKKKNISSMLCNISNERRRKKMEIFKQMKYCRNLFTYTYVLIWYAFEDMRECHEQPVIEWHTRNLLVEMAT